MKLRKDLFYRVPNNQLLIAIILLTFIKIFIYILVSFDLIHLAFGGGSDANYYNSYALGYTNVALNFWPIMLRALNNIGLYSREVISYTFFFLNITVIPVLTCKLAGLSIKKQPKYFLYLFLISLLYPTLFFYSFDIYRDVFMVFSFLVGCLTIKEMLSTKNIVYFIFLFIVSLLIGSFLLRLRPYLGYAFILSMFLVKIKFTKKRIVILGLLYTLALFGAYSFGALDKLIEYRAGFDSNEAGSTLGLDFTNPILFLPNLILSTFGQLFGLYVTNPFAVILLLIETIPFIGMLSYIIRNIKLADSFARFLIIFFVLYASVWLIGNDNLGTSLRLRSFNYISVYICFFSILKIKQTSTTNS